MNTYHTYARAEVTMLVKEQLLYSTSSYTILVVLVVHEYMKVHHTYLYITHINITY